MWGGGYYYLTKDKTPQSEQGASNVQQEIKIDFQSNKEEGTNLLNDHNNKDNTTKEVVEPSRLTTIIQEREQWATQAENYSFVILNNVNIQDKDYVEVFNQYIDNLKINGFKNYVFYEMTNAWLNDLLCSEKFNATKTEKFNLFSSLNKLSYIDTIVRFKKIANNNPTMKLFILWDSVDSCNNIQEISRALPELWTNNNNIFIIGLNKTATSGQAWTVSKEEEYLNELSIKTGIQYIKVKNPWVLSDTVNAKIYPINFWRANLLNEDINAELLFFDADNNTTAAKVSVYRQKWSTFLKHWEYTNDSITQLSLQPWTYYFEIRDLSSNMIIRTEKEVINSTKKYKRHFYFRKTKATIRIDNEEDKPVLGDFMITDLSNWGFLFKEAKGVSQIIQDLSPWKYNIRVNTHNKFFFSEDVVIEWQPDIEIKFREENKTIRVKVLYWEGNIKNDAVVKIFNSNGDNIYTLQWGDVSATVGAWQYKIEAVDINSGSKVSREVNVSKAAPSTTFDLTFKSMPTIIDVWDNPLMLRIYEKQVYDSLSWWPIDKQKNALRSISGSRQLKMNFLAWDYHIDVFNIDGKHLGSKTFNVWDFDENFVSLNDGIFNN